MRFGQIRCQMQCLVAVRDNLFIGNANITAEPKICVAPSDAGIGPCISGVDFGGFARSLRAALIVDLLPQIQKLRPALKITFIGLCI